MIFHSTAGRRAAIGVLALLLASVSLCGCSGKKSAPDPAPATQSPAATPATAAPAPQPVKAEPVKTEPPKPTPPPPELAGALAVMIDNHPDAVPQSGVDKADIVYEMEAEGGITRFMTLFYRHSADKIGPVRSARLGFYDIATAYGVPYAHCGGNYDVLLQLKNDNTRLLNLDEIYTSGGAFWRTTDREAPHNLYTSTKLILGRAKELGFTLRPLLYFPEGDTPSGGAAASEIAFSWGPKTQQVSWTWNGKRYQRSQAGQPDVLQDGVRLETDNLLLLFTKFVWDQQAQDGEGQNNVSIVGSGSGYFYRDGKVFPIRWSKAARAQPYKFTLQSGEPVPFAAGQSWVEVLKSPADVTAGAPQ